MFQRWEPLPGGIQPCGFRDQKLGQNRARRGVASPAVADQRNLGRLRGMVRPDAPQIPAGHQLAHHDCGQQRKPRPTTGPITSCARANGSASRTVPPGAAISAPNRAAASAARSAIACSSSASRAPIAVIRTARVVRAINCTPSAASSAEMWPVTVEGGQGGQIRQVQYATIRITSADKIYIHSLSRMESPEDPLKGPCHDALSGAFGPDAPASRNP